MTHEITAKLRRFSPADPFRGIGPDLFVRSGQECCLGKKTIVYGRNGTGKTTFAELLRQMNKGALSRSQVKAWYFENGSWRSGALPDGVVRRIHVFNRYYIEDELRFFLDGGGDSPGILKLGAHNVQSEVKLQDTRDTIARNKERLRRLEEAKSALTSEIDATKREVKQRVVDTLGALIPTYTTQTFTVAKAHKLLTTATSQPLSEDEGEQRLELLRLPHLPVVSEPAAPAIDLLALRQKVAEASSRALTSVVVPELRDNAGLASWVQAGLVLHPSGDEPCQFCASGRLAASLRAEYAAHFDLSSDELRADLADLVLRLNQAKDLLTQWRAALPEADELLPGFRANWAAAIAAADAQLEVHVEYLVSLEWIASQRLDALYSPLSEMPGECPAELDVAALKKVATENNVDAGRQNSLRDQAELDIQAHVAQPHRQTYQTLNDRVPLAGQAITRVSARINALQLDEHHWRDEQHDVGQMADLINQDLADHLGHVHLRLTVSDDGRGYRVLRDGGPSQNLSEGERNSLALLYFLRSLEADDVTPWTDLVVMDDPVTSLDKDALFAVFSLVTERTQNFGQVVLLTHDFELFRLLLMRYKNAYSKSAGAIKKGDPEEKRFPAIQFLESRAFRRNGAERGVSLQPMSPRLLSQPTEYHYLFHRIADALLQEDEENLPLLGNAARRLLEGFVAFKAPNEGKFQGKVEGAARLAGVSSELTQRIVRFVHGTSHREEPNPSATFDSASLPEELGQVLHFMYACDNDHFQKMCKAVGVDFAVQIAQWNALNAAPVAASVPQPPTTGATVRSPPSAPDTEAAMLPI